MGRRSLIAFVRICSHLFAFAPRTNEKIVPLAIERDENIRVAIPAEFLNNCFELVKQYIVELSCKSL
jgi:hypothetical protein